MKNYQIKQISEALDVLEAAVIRNGVPKKHLMDIKAVRQAVIALEKLVEKGTAR